MLNRILEATRLRTNGKWDLTRLAVLGVLFGGFVLWRATSGSHGADEVLGIIERDLVETFKYQQHQQHAAARESAADSTEATAKYFATIADVDVKFSNVTILAPLTSWEINEQVAVRFDYELLAAGAIQQAETRRYVQVTRKGQGIVHNSGPVRHYLSLLF